MPHQTSTQTIISSDVGEQLSLLDTVEMGMDHVDDLKSRLKYMRESLESELLQNDEYKDSKEKMKLMREEHKVSKMKAMRSPMCIELADKIDEDRANLKLEKQSLSATILFYQEESGQTSISHNDKTYKIVKSARLQKEKSEKKGKKRN